MRLKCCRSARSELSALRSDPWLLSLSVYLPLAGILLFASIFSAEVPRQLPIGVVDHDHSVLSRKVIQYLDASPALAISAQFSSLSEAKRSIASGETYALVYVPEKLAHDVELAKSPSVTIFVNAQYLLVAKSIRSAVSEVVTTLSIEAQVARELPGLPVVAGALAAAYPVRNQITALYNRALNYSQFLLPGISLALMQILISCITVLSLGRELKRADVTVWQVVPFSSAIIGKLLPYTGIFLVHLLLMFFLFFAILDWPLQASLLLLLPSLVSFVVACQVIGAFFFALSFNMERALSFAGAFSAPAFAFLGVTFPVSDMSAFASFWRELMPAAHFLDAYLIRSTYAGGLGALLGPTLALLSPLLLLPWTWSRLRAKVARA